MSPRLSGMSSKDLAEIHEEAMSRLANWSPLDDPHDLVSTIMVALGALNDRIVTLEGAARTQEEGKP